MTASGAGKETDGDALSRRLSRLGVRIDSDKLEAVERVNDAKLHGAILLIRYPGVGEAAERARRWEEDVRRIAGDGVRFNENLHLAEASLTDPPHLERPLREPDLAHLDLDGFLRSIERASPFVIRLARTYLDPDGNLVVAGRAVDDQPARLREEWKEAGLWIKGHPPVEDASCTFHATLTHLPRQAWEGMSDPEIEKLACWLARQAILAPPADLSVPELQVVCMNERSGRALLGDDIRLPLGRPSGLSAAELRGIVLERFGAERAAGGGSAGP